MKYVFVGDGMGVPGLPHEISDDEANEQGLSRLLQDAIENGTYVPMVTNQEDPKLKKSKGSKE